MNNLNKSVSMFGNNESKIPPNTLGNQGGSFLGTTGNNNKPTNIFSNIENKTSNISVNTENNNNGQTSLFGIKKEAEIPSSSIPSGNFISSGLAKNADVESEKINDDNTKTLENKNQTETNKTTFQNSLFGAKNNENKILFGSSTTQNSLFGIKEKSTENSKEQEKVENPVPSNSLFRSIVPKSNLFSNNLFGAKAVEEKSKAQETKSSSIFGEILNQVTKNDNIEKIGVKDDEKKDLEKDKLSPKFASSIENKVPITINTIDENKLNISTNVPIFTTPLFPNATFKPSTLLGKVEEKKTDEEKKETQPKSNLFGNLATNISSSGVGIFSNTSTGIFGNLLSKPLEASKEDNNNNKLPEKIENELLKARENQVNESKAGNSVSGTTQSQQQDCKSSLFGDVNKANKPNFSIFGNTELNKTTQGASSSNSLFGNESNNKLQSKLFYHFLLIYLNKSFKIFL